MAVASHRRTRRQSGPVSRSEAASASPGMKLSSRADSGALQRQPWSGRAHQPTLRPGAANLPLEGLERLRGRLDVLRNREEHSEKRLAKGADAGERGPGLGRPKLDLHQHRMGALLVQPAGLQAPRDEILRGGQMLTRLGQAVPAQAVQEVEHRVAAGQR